MMKQIFDDFLAYKGKSFKESTVPAIFSLIYNEKKKDPAYFEFLENIIRRRTKCTRTKESIIKVLNDVYAEITPEIPERQKWKRGWVITAHFFYVLKEIDLVAIRNLLPTEYEEFVSEATLISEKVYTAYISDNVTIGDWDILPILQMQKTNESQEIDSWGQFFAGCAFTWLLYKFKP